MSDSTVTVKFDPAWPVLVSKKDGMFAPYERARLQEQVSRAAASGDVIVCDGSIEIRPLGPTHEHIACVCHEVNRAYCESLGDHSQLPWDQAAEWQRTSAIRGVEYALAHPDAAPSAQHDAWTADKLADGWKYGPVKDADKKEHPCLVPYEELPAAQRTKDALFLAVVRAMRPTFAAPES